MVRSCGPTDGRCGRFVERHQSALNFALLVVGYILYLLIGAGIFSAIEQPYEQELRRELRTARRDFLSNNTCVSDAHLEQLLVRALEASNYGVTVLGNDTERNWDFVSSLFFTSTVLTTTGYGHSVPLSDEGKAFCIFYALFGIPVTLFFLTVVVQRIMLLVTRRPVSYFHRRWAVSKSTLAAIHATCLATITVLLLLIIPAWILVSLERDWDFLESLYFCFISLTTIGLGDYVPGQAQSKQDNPHPRLYRLAITDEGFLSLREVKRIQYFTVRMQQLLCEAVLRHDSALSYHQHVYLLLGLVFVLVVMETCCELPQIKRLRQKFYQEKVRELDSETTNIIDQDHLSDQLSDPTDHLPVIPSVSEQAASLRQDSKSTPYTPALGSDVNGKLR